VIFRNNGVFCIDFRCFRPTLSSSCCLCRRLRLITINFAKFGGKSFQNSNFVKDRGLADFLRHLLAMPVTPARAAREKEKSEQKREEGRLANEAKYSEFKIHCDNGVVGACNALGEWFAMMREDFKQALDLYKPACLEHKHPQACYNMGNLLILGKGAVPKDVPMAVKAWETGCREGNADSCVESARVLMKDALVKFDAADPSAGAKKAGSVGTEPQSSSTTPPPTPLLGQEFDAHRSLKTGLELLAIGCDADSTVSNARCCGMLGASFFSAKLPVAEIWTRKVTAGSAPLSREGAAAAAGSPGEAGSGSSRLSAADAEKIAKELPALPHPVELLQRSCDREHASGCMDLARLYRHGHKGVGIEKDDETADNYERKALMWTGKTERQANREIARRKALAAVASVK
jgi:TPR repeat protein